MVDMEIRITKHCMERFKERTFDLNLTESELIEIISRGRIIRTRPGNAYELETHIEGRKHYFAIKKEHSTYTVLTYLGDADYREWVFKNEILARYRSVRKKSRFKMTEPMEAALI